MTRHATPASGIRCVGCGRLGSTSCERLNAHAARFRCGCGHVGPVFVLERGTRAQADALPVWGAPQ